MPTVYHPLKLVYSLPAKNASRTIHSAMFGLAGIEDDHPYHRWRRSRGDDMASLGFENIWWRSAEDVEELTRRFADYHWFCVVRDPARRLMSAYRDLPNRYARVGDRKAYRRAKLKHILSGPAHWGRNSVMKAELHRLISPDEFVRGLRQVGVDIDSHYMLQSDTIMPRHARYDLIMRVENLDEGYRKLADHLGRPMHDMPPLGTLGNTDKKLKQPRPSFSAGSLALIAEMYREDYEALGYPLPAAEQPGEGVSA